jgi:hypothetical protein
MSSCLVSLFVPPIEERFAFEPPAATFAGNLKRSGELTGASQP